MDFRDGLGILEPGCPISPFIVPPGGPCPTGTNAFVVRGDVDGNDIDEGGFFIGLNSLIPRLLIEPFRADLVELVAAPPSDLPRPLGLATDTSAIVFFDVLTIDVRQVFITAYSFLREYPEGDAGLNQMNGEVVQGEYRFVLPTIDSPDLRSQLFPVQSAIRPFLNSIAEDDRLKNRGFRYTTGIYDDEGRYLIDPRLVNRISWTGNTPENVLRGADVWRFSIIEEDGALDPNTNEIVDRIVFPFSGLAPLLIDDPLEQEFLMPPFVFEVGDEFRMRMALERVLPVTGVSFNTSSRLFHADLQFVDSYDGFVLETFPVGTTAADRTPGVDFDGDGFTNLLEFGLMSDPVDPASQPNLPQFTFNIDGTLSAEVLKRPFAALIYEMEISENGGPFRLVPDGTPDWEVTVDDDTRLRIKSKGFEIPNNFKVRVKLTQVDLNNDL